MSVQLLFPELLFVTEVKQVLISDWLGRRFNVWMSGTWSERAGLFSDGNKYCHHQWELLHLFNVPFPKWNSCNPTDMATSPCISPLWNLIRAKTVYQCLESDIYWKWPLLKVIARAWKGFLMSLWSFSSEVKWHTLCYVNLSVRLSNSFGFSMTLNMSKSTICTYTNCDSGNHGSQKQTSFIYFTDSTAHYHMFLFLICHPSQTLFT